MPDDNDTQRATMIFQIDQLISQFQAKIRSRTTDPDNFLSISELEEYWSNLRNSTDKIYSDSVSDIIGNMNEKALIRQKKKSTEVKASTSRQTKKTKEQS
jgi:hypothetical protein